MSYIPTPEQALELTKRYNKEAFHIQHAETVGKVMRYLAGKYDPGMEDYWQAVGILHDIDFEQWRCSRRSQSRLGDMQRRRAGALHGEDTLCYGRAHGPHLGRFPHAPHWF